MARCFYVLGWAGGGGGGARRREGSEKGGAPTRAHTAPAPPPPPGQTLSFFNASDSKSIVVIGLERGVRSLFLRKRDLTPEAVGCCFCFCFFLLIFRG